MPRRRFDHDAALAEFIADPQRSFGKIARKFGVTDTAVRRVAKRDNWEALADEADRKTAEKLLVRAVRALEVRNAETVRVADRLRKIALDNDAEIPVQVAIQALPAYAKLEQLFAGEPTDRIDPGQVQQVLAIVLRLAVRGLPPEEFLAEFNTAVAGVLEAGPAPPEEEAA